MVGQRRALLDYLKRKNVGRYEKLIQRSACAAKAQAFPHAAIGYFRLPKPARTAELTQLRVCEAAAGLWRASVSPAGMFLRGG